MGADKLGDIRKERLFVHCRNRGVQGQEDVDSFRQLENAMAGFALYAAFCLYVVFLLFGPFAGFGFSAL
jgi:hypothetical protein